MSVRARGRVWLVTMVAAALVVVGSPGPAAADPDDISDAERQAWTEQERREHGQQLWPDRPVEEPVGSETSVAKVPRIDWAPPDPVLATELPEGSEATLDVTDADTETVEAGPVTVDLGGNVEELSAVDDARVRITVSDGEQAKASGIEGVMLQVLASTELTEPVDITIDYSAYADAYGGDWADRLRLVSLPGCEPTSTELCGDAVPVDSVNDHDSQTVSATVPPEGVGTMALMAATAGSTGDWAATPLSPSATWEVSARTGDFSWSYPLRVPPAGSYPTPELALGYSSGSVDGRVASTNNQTSAIGEGWGLSSGFVERSYVPCVTDTSGSPNNASHPTGDLCWGTQNATLQLDGQAFELILDASTNTWRPRQDNGMKVERLTGAWNNGQDGEYWRVTGTDGTQYYFGRDKRSAGDTLALNSAWTVPVFGNHAGEPCYNSSYSSAWCDQVWRWNLDYVVDVSGNTMTYVYAKETNNYGRNNNTAVSTYDRGGYLSRIDYAQRQGSETANAPARVSFTVAERCLPSGSITCTPAQLTAANASHWPDVPFDLICTSSSSCASVTSPVFFTRKRLITITTMVWNGSAYRNVDKWDLTHSFPDPGDGTSKQLWLDSVKHTGLAGSTNVAMPAVTFAGVQMPNRVDEIGDLGPPMIRYRISSITTETGAVTSINYSTAGCTPASLPANPHTNTRRCLPVFWDPEGPIGMTLEYFHKYLVTSTVDSPGDVESEPIVTTYSYQGDPAWHYTDNDLIPPDRRTWSDFRGYGSVEVSVGNSVVTKLRTVYEFFRGMHGDRATPTGGTKTVTVDGISDHPDYAGMVRTETTYNGSVMVSTTTNTPWRSAPTATNTEGRTARYAAIATVQASINAPALSGGQRTTRTVTTYDSYGMPTTVEDQGDTAKSGDERCTRYEYARNTGANILSTVRRVETVAVACGTTPSRPTHVISDVRTSYDGLAYGATPTDGLPTKTERVASYSGSTPSYQTVTTATYDASGRVLSIGDALGRTTTTSYTPALGGLVSSITVTSPDPDGSGPLTAHTTTTAFDTAWGAQLSVTDPNGKVTSGAYDALGRLTGVWLPGRVQGIHSANTTYAYTVSTTGTNTVTTKSLIHDGTYLTTVTLYDGLLRERQTQSPTADRETPGRIVTDVVYDSRGLVAYEHGPWYTTGNPATTIVVPTAAVPLRTSYTYDGAGRVTNAITEVNESEVWRTTASYGGDRVTTVPPAGGIPTTEIYDAYGRTIELRQYQGATATGPYDAVSYGYDLAGNGTSMTDAVGNDWGWTYDLAGRLISQTDPDTGTTSYAYDAADQRISSTDARGVTLHTVYDNAGRRTELREDDATGTLLSSWTWDTIAKGQPTSSTRIHDGGAYTTAVTAYDDGYRPLAQSVTIPAAEGALAGTYAYTHAYTIDGQPKSTVIPAAGGLGAESLTMFYDNRGIPEWMGGGFGWGVYVSGTRYSVYGELLIMDVGASYANLINYSYQHGTRRPDQMWLQRETASSYDIDISYDFDNAGNLLSIDDAAVDDTQCFTYAQARLTHAWTPSSGNCGTTRSASMLGGPAPYWHTYSHDAAGNRTTLVDHQPSGNLTTTYTRPAAGTDQAHTLTSTSTTGGTSTSYTYDEAGNTLTRTTGANTQTLTWDPEGRLEALTHATGTDEYLYTPEGERLIRRQGDTTTLYLPGGQELTLTDGVVTATRFYTFNGQLVATRTSPGTPNLTSHVVDHQGTAILGIANTGNTATRRYHDPYGNPRDATVPIWTSDHGFLNKPTDTTGLTQVGARYYDPTIGQFISPDPILHTGWPQQFHPYSYANATPTVLSDPTGLYPGTRMLHDGGGGSSSSKPPLGGLAKKPSSSTILRWVSSAVNAPIQTAVAAAVHLAPKLKTAVRGAHAIYWNHIVRTRRLDDLPLLPQPDTSGLHAGLDLASVAATPAVGVGEGFDIANAAIYAMEGDLGNAAWSMLGALPAIGGVFIAARVARTSFQSVDALTSWRPRPASSQPGAGSAGGAAEAAAAAPRVTFGHGARHLDGTGLGVEEVESTILQQVTSAAAESTAQTGRFWGRIEIRGTTIEYRAYTLTNGTINVGTYYVP